MENESSDFNGLNGGTITITNGGTSTGTGIYQSWYPYIPTTEIQIGKCTLKEVDGELHWIYPDGTSTVLTGKGKNFNDLYNLMNEPEDTTR